jgi:PAS domain S-box-containing protein
MKDKKPMERRERGEMPRHDEEYCRALVNSVRDYAIFRLDKEGHVNSWNPGAQWIKGYEADEIIGKHFSCFFPAQAVENGRPAHALAQAIDKGRFQEEALLLRKGGMSFWADMVITSLKDASESLQGFALVSCDISARKEAEAERERLIQELQTTLNNVKILSGHLPICASCKKIRDYRGQWHPMEIYLRNHSEATLTHEFCAECATLIQSSNVEA